MVHCVLEDNPYSHRNIVGIPNEISLPSTHFFMTPMPKSEPLVDNVEEDHYTSSKKLKEKQIINQSKLVNDHLKLDESFLSQKIIL